MPKDGPRVDADGLAYRFTVAFMLSNYTTLRTH